MVEDHVDSDTGEVLDHKGRRLDALGRELPDPSSLAPPIGFVRQPPLHELIRQMVRSEALRQEAAAYDFGSFEDEDDFDVDDEYDPTSPWENEFEPPNPPDATSSQSAAEATVLQDQSAAAAEAPVSDAPKP